MDKIDADRLDLAEEFKASPFGPHSRDLQKILNIMRWMPTAGKPVVVCTRAHQEWCVGEQPASRGTPVKIYTEQPYSDHGQAFWQVFKRRWSLLTGRELPID